MFPEDFNWKVYKRLFDLEDRAAWAYLFAIRDKSAGIALNEIGYSRTVNTEVDIEKIPRLEWRDGVCCSGMKGHRTHDNLVARKEYLSQQAEWISVGDYEERKAYFKKGQVITSGHRNKLNGYFIFPDKESFDGYEKVQRALDSCTIEFAINIRMPKDMLLKEIASIISREQRKYGGAFKIKKLPRQTTKQWVRGLACWDLIEERSLTKYQVAKYLAPLWREHDTIPKHDEPALDEDKKQVATALKSVSPMVSGGWKVLCGDPVATIGSDLIELQYK